MRLPSARAAAAALVLAMAASTPAGAKCADAHLILSPGFVKNEDSCLAYCVSEAPNFSARASALFWALGSGDPVVGRGNDSGAFDSGLWIRGKLPYNYGNGTFYNFQRTLGTNWGAHFLIDGCIKQDGPRACTCLLLGDESGGRGYFAILSARADERFNFDFGSSGVVLGRIPQPSARGSAGPGGTMVEVAMEAPKRGVQPDAAGDCPCGPVGYRVVERVQAPGAPAPVSRDAALWHAPERSDGRPQTNTPFGRAVTVRSSCTKSGEVVWIAALLVFEDGFTTPVVSASPDPLPCRPAGRK